MRLALLKLLPTSRTHATPILLVPSITVNIIPLHDFAQMLNASQHTFVFFVTSPISLTRTTDSTLRFAKSVPAFSQREYNAAISRYITQFDFLKQIQQFLTNLEHLPNFNEYFTYVRGSTPVIVIGKELFMRDAIEDTITGDFDSDGYSALYDTSDYNGDDSNICVISTTKFTVADTYFQSAVVRAKHMDRSPQAVQYELAQRIFLASNIAHFLLLRMFRINPSQNLGDMQHDMECIMDLNMDGGLVSSITQNKLCPHCRDIFRNTGLSAIVGAVVSSNDVIDASQCLTKGVERIIRVEQLAEFTKKMAAAVSAAVAVAVMINVISAVEYNHGESFQISTIPKMIMQHSPYLALCVVAGAGTLMTLLLLISGLCKWITRGSKATI